jgi:hypothetical protein
MIHSFNVRILKIISLEYFKSAPIFKVITRCGLVGAITCVASLAQAAPTTVTFDSFLGQQFFDGFTPTATSEGYDFTSSALHFHLGDNLPNPPATSGMLLQDIPDNIITMTKNGGGAFDLLSAAFAQIVFTSTPLDTSDNSHSTVVPS